MILSKRSLRVLFLSLFIAHICAQEPVIQPDFDSIIREIIARSPLVTNQLHGGASAHVNLVRISPSTFVVRKINSNNSLALCIQETVLAKLCSDQEIGPRLYASDPESKYLILEYLQDKGRPRDPSFAEAYVRDFGALIKRFHAIDVESMKQLALDRYQYDLTISEQSLFACEYLVQQIEAIPSIVGDVGLPIETIKEWGLYFEQKLEQLHEEHGSEAVFLHGDLHWGNCLFAYDKPWLIDYESCGLGPWWYDLGVLGAHISFCDEDDNVLLSGYFGLNQEIPEWKIDQYRCMKYIAMLFYASHRLALLNKADVEEALKNQMDLNAIHNAYRNNTFFLESNYEHALLAIGMIRYVGEKHKAIIQS